MFKGFYSFPLWCTTISMGNQTIRSELSVVVHNLFQTGKAVYKFLFRHAVSCVPMNIRPHGKHIPGFTQHFVQGPHGCLAVAQEGCRLLQAAKRALVRLHGKSSRCGHPVGIEGAALELCGVRLA